jgi:hypothetical protein
VAKFFQGAPDLEIVVLLTNANKKEFRALHIFFELASFEKGPIQVSTQLVKMMQKWLLIAAAALSSFQVGSQ